MQERGPVSLVFIKFDSMEVTVSLARAISLECRDGSLCVVGWKGNGKWRLQL